MGLVSKQSRALISQLDQLVEEGFVGVGLLQQLVTFAQTCNEKLCETHLVAFSDDVFASRLLIDSVLEKGYGVVILEGNFDFALVLASSLFQGRNVNVVLWHSLQFLRREPNAAILFIEILVGLDGKLAHAFLK